MLPKNPHLQPLIGNLAWRVTLRGHQDRVVIFHEQIQRLYPDESVVALEVVPSIPATVMRTGKSWPHGFVAKTHKPFDLSFGPGDLLELQCYKPGTVFLTARVQPKEAQEATA